jgi:hypothetical protein
VAEGIHRTDVDYIWPPLVRPRQGAPRLVYLDLNHWIGLAKAATRHRDGGRYEDVLNVLDYHDPRFPLVVAVEALKTST